MYLEGLKLHWSAEAYNWGVVNIVHCETSINMLLSHFFGPWERHSAHRWHVRDTLGTESTMSLTFSHNKRHMLYKPAHTHTHTHTWGQCITRWVLTTVCLTSFALLGCCLDIGEPHILGLILDDQQADEGEGHTNHPRDRQYRPPAVCLGQHCGNNGS